MIVSIDAKKYVTNLTLIHDNNSQQTMNTEQLPQLNKGHPQKPIANIVLNGDKYKAFPLRSETRRECPLSSLIFNIILGVLLNKMRQKGNRRYAEWEGRN